MEGIGSDGFGEEATQALIDKVLEFDYKLGEEKIDGDSATVEAVSYTHLSVLYLQPFLYLLPYLRR